MEDVMHGPMGKDYPTSAFTAIVKPERIEYLLGPQQGRPRRAIRMRRGRSSGATRPE